MRRPKILNKSTIIKHELLMCRDDESDCNCTQCSHNKTLLELIEYVEELERQNIVNHNFYSNDSKENKELKIKNMKLKQENLNLKLLSSRNRSIENDPELSNENKYLLELAGLK